MPEDEWDAISINYTSGTTGDPKGVVYHHRGAYLLAQGNILVTSMPKHAVYLWTLPMFHYPKWGEAPCAFVELAAGVQVSAEQLQQWCRQHLAAYKVPAHFIFAPILRTATGKIQKFILRNQARDTTTICNELGALGARGVPPAV